MIKRKLGYKKWYSGPAWDRLKRVAWWYNIDLWSSETCVHVAMYLLLTPNPYSGEDLVNHESMYWKTEKTFFVGQLSNAVQLNSFHGMQPRSTFRIQSGIHSRRPRKLAWWVRSLHWQVDKLVLNSSKFVLSIIQTSSCFNKRHASAFLPIVPYCFSRKINFLPTCTSLLFFLSFLPSSLLVYFLA